jgi:hypothetical protein
LLPPPALGLALIIFLPVFSMLPSLPKAKGLNKRREAR